MISGQIHRPSIIKVTRGYSSAYVVEFAPNALHCHLSSGTGIVDVRYYHGLHKDWNARPSGDHDGGSIWYQWYLFWPGVKLAVRNLIATIMLACHYFIAQAYTSTRRLQLYCQCLVELEVSWDFLLQMSSGWTRKTTGVGLIVTAPPSSHPDTLGVALAWMAQRTQSALAGKAKCLTTDSAIWKQRKAAIWLPQLCRK